jgi:GNAT superfamily N-acetyltransferase
MLTIRDMARRDLPQIQRLLTQLGYQLEPAEVQRRFEAVIRAPAHAVLVAEQDARIIGLLHLYARPALEKVPAVIVQAIVVEEGTRRAGLGRSLMNAAEEWTKERGFATVALTSHIARSNAHAFYERLGYRIEATSYLMRKALR